MKTVLHSVSYAGVWPGQARLSLDAFLDKAARLQYEGVMLMAKRPHLSLLDFGPSERQRLRGRLQERGLECSVLAGYTDFCLGTEHPEVPAREMQVLYVRELARLAADLDCRLVRVFTGYTAPGVGLDQCWNWCVESLRECAKLAGDLGVTIGVQNHHDTAVHYDSLVDLLETVDHPHCKAMFDAWAPALHGCDLAEAVRRVGPWIVHTTVADYVRRPRFSYVPQFVNYVRETDAIRAVPMGAGFIDYRGFFRALRETGYTGAAAYEMCSPLQGGGSEENLDRCARRFREWMASDAKESQS